MEIKTFNIEYKAVYNFQTVTMSCEFTGDATDEEIAKTKEYLRQFSEAAVKELANDLQNTQPVKAVNNNRQTPQPARSNNQNYNRNANQYPSNTNGYPASKKSYPVSDNQRTILLRAGYDEEQIASWDFATAKQIISDIFNNQ